MPVFSCRTEVVLPPDLKNKVFPQLRKITRHHVVAMLVAVLAVVAALGASGGEIQRKKLLTQQFEARPVSQVEIGDFHFTPGQIAPIHTHAAPVFGYVSKGAIFYQVEGRKPQLLRAGDAFYEPVGPNILHFDNASRTEEAVFTDFNFERTGEPFIVFPTPPTEKIDRRSFPTKRLDGAIADTMEVYEQSLSPAEKVDLPGDSETAYAYVAQGSVSVQISGQAPIVYLAGQTFYEPKPSDGTRVVNASNSSLAKVIAFRLSSSTRASNREQPSLELQAVVGQEDQAQASDPQLAGVTSSAKKGESHE